jgi:hypothetical protein
MRDDAEIKAFESWQHMIVFYEDFIGSYQWPLENMLQLTIRLSQSVYADILYASQSLHCLVISAGSDYYARMELPMVSVEPVLSEAYRIHYYHRGHSAQEVFCDECSASEIDSILHNILNRLKSESNELH